MKTHCFYYWPKTSSLDPRFPKLESHFCEGSFLSRGWMDVEEFPLLQQLSRQNIVPTMIIYHQSIKTEKALERVSDIRRL